MLWCRVPGCGVVSPLSVLWCCVSHWLSVLCCGVVSLSVMWCRVPVCAVVSCPWLSVVFCLPLSVVLCPCLCCAVVSCLLCLWCCVPVCAVLWRCSGRGLGGVPAVSARSLLQQRDDQRRGHAERHGVPRRLPLLSGARPGTPALRRLLPHRLLLPRGEHRKCSVANSFVRKVAVSSPKSRQKSLDDAIN